MFIEEEFAQAVSKMVKKNTAPGPDGIHGQAVQVEIHELNTRARRLLNECLEPGEFPWNIANLTPKPGMRLTDSPSTFRPIYLLQVVGKLTERIVSSRINTQLPYLGPDIADDQYWSDVPKSVHLA